MAPKKSKRGSGLRTAKTKLAPVRPIGTGAYVKHRSRMAKLSRERSQTGREVGLPEAPQNLKRKEACRNSFRLFCETYLLHLFLLPWSPDHLKVIAKIESAVLKGGQFAFAMPRKSGKTTLCESAALWAMLYGHRRCVVFIGAEGTSAAESFDTIREEIETNDLLDEDFREVTKYVRALEGITQRTNAQTAGGKRTRVEWSNKLVRFPNIDGYSSSGAIAKAVGITGRIRGMKIAGRRPDLAILDDPQTDETAMSLATNNKLERIISGAVLGLAGQKRKIACFMPCTVIAPGDMAERLLDRGRNPDWQGERMKMLYKFPDRMDLWEQYATVRADGLRLGDHSAATKFYLEHRAEMNAGAVMAWPEQYDDDEHSAVQHAMNLYFKKKASFLAEYQNEPELPDLGAIDELKVGDVCCKLNNHPRGVCPSDVSRVTAFVDVGNRILFWCVVGWSESFSGHVLDYGTYPRQTRTIFAADDARPSLADECRGMNEDARIYRGVTAAAAIVCGRTFARETGGELRVERCFVDSGKWPKAVASACRQSPHVGILTPSKGWGVGSGRRAMSSWALKQGQRRGDYWVMQPNTDGGYGRLVIYDANHWKSFIAKALQTPEMNPGCLQLFGVKGKDDETHRLFAAHLTAEYRSGKWSAVGEQVEQELWSRKPDRPDNHWWDTLVGCAAAASFAGLAFSAAVAAGEPIVPKAPRKKVKMSEIFAAKNGTGGWR